MRAGERVDVRADQPPRQRPARWCVPVATALSTLAAANAGSAGAQDAGQGAVAGQVLTVAGECSAAPDGAEAWLALKPGSPIAPGQRLRCPLGAELRLRLPGSGAEVPVRVRPGQDYVVPMGRLGPTPATETRGGREASVAPHMMAPGAAPAGTVVYADSGIARCAAPLGTLALTDDPGSATSKQASARGLEPPAALLRRYAQESNCFVVADVRWALSNALQESARAGTRPTESPGAVEGSAARTRPARPAERPSEDRVGRLAAADFVMDPRIDFAGAGEGRALGGLLGITGPGVGAVAGAVARAGQPTSRLMLFDARSGVAIGAAEGRPDAVDPAALQRWLASEPSGPGAGYAKSTEGALAAAALAASFNQLVQQTAVLQGQAVARPVTAAAKPASAASAAAPTNDPSRAPP